MQDSQSCVSLALDSGPHTYYVEHEASGATSGKFNVVSVSWKYNDQLGDLTGQSKYGSLYAFLDQEKLCLSLRQEGEAET